MPKKAPMPESVKIGPFDFKVVSNPEGHLKAEDAAGMRLSGRGSGRDLELHLHPQHAVGYQRSTMVHEIIHQVFEVSGTGLDYEDEEKICRALEGGLLGTLRDNPDLVAWLTAVQ